MKVLDSLALGLNDLTGSLSQDRRVTPPTPGENVLKARFASIYEGELTESSEKALVKLERALRKAEVRYTIPQTVFKRLGGHGLLAALVGGSSGLFFGHFWTDIPYHQAVEAHSGLAFLAFRGPYEFFKFYKQVMPLVPYLKTDIPKAAKWIMSEDFVSAVANAFFAGAHMMSQRDKVYKEGDALIERDVTDEVPQGKAIPSAQESMNSAWQRFCESAIIRSEVVTSDFDGSFRSAFLPSIMVASAVLAAGIDLDGFFEILEKQPALAVFLQVYYVSKGIQLPLAGYAMIKPYVSAVTETHINKRNISSQPVGLDALQQQLTQDPKSLTSRDMSALLAHRRIESQLQRLPQTVAATHQVSHAAPVSWSQRARAWNSRNVASLRGLYSRILHSRH